MSEHSDTLRRAAENARLRGGDLLAALAEWLDTRAVELDANLPHWTGERWAGNHAPVDDPPPPGWQNPEWVDRAVRCHFEHELRVAALLTAPAPDQAQRAAGEK